MTNPVEAYEQARTSGAAYVVQRSVIRATGPETQKFLQGQLSQDIDALTDGESTLSFILQPHGKVDALLRVTKVADDNYLLDTDAGFTDQLLERLNRFKLRTKTDFEPLQWNALALRGPITATVATPDGAIRSDAHWCGIESVDILGEGLQLPDGVAQLDKYGYETLRIESGMPAMGSELDEKTIPAEAGVNDRAINFRKGCYTGQELVARIDARGGNVPRYLAGVVFETEDPPARGTKLLPVNATSAAKPLGLLTSVAQRPGSTTVVALAYIRRDATVPLDAVVDCDDVKINARVMKLPIEA